MDLTAAASPRFAIDKTLCGSYLLQAMRVLKIAVSCLWLVTPSVLVTGLTKAENWPRFRGASGNPSVADDSRLPDTWSNDGECLLEDGHSRAGLVLSCGLGKQDLLNDGGERQSRRERTAQERALPRSRTAGNSLGDPSLVGVLPRSCYWRD